MSRSSRVAAARAIPEATVTRLPVYLRVLKAMSDDAVATVSSDDLAGACGVSPAMLRKDLSHLGSYGTRGVGYSVALLTYHISQALGLTQPWGVVIVGVGKLGQALTAYRGFGSRGFDIVALVDVDPAVVGTSVAGLPVHALADLRRVVADTGAQIGVIATPAEAAQRVGELLVAAGVRSILNFAPVVLALDDDVEVRKVDLASELQILAFHEQQRADEPLREAVHA